VIGFTEVVGMASGDRTLQCIDCDRPDPLQNPSAQGWLKGQTAAPSCGAASLARQTGGVNGEMCWSALDQRECPSS